MAASLIRSRAMVTHAMDRHRWNEIADGAVPQQDGAIAEIASARTFASRFLQINNAGTTRGDPACRSARP